MKSNTQVLVIGGGVVGASVLYHLTKLGWQDVTLIERSELTAGSSWHAAGGFHTMNSDTNMAALQGYTIDLYEEIEKLSGQACGVHRSGGVTLASTEERMDYLRAEHAKYRYMGLDTRLLTPGEAKELLPVVNTEGLVGALYDPLDGHLDPAGTTHAYARAAQKNGATVILRNRVLATRPREGGGWEVETEQGPISADHLVNAAGLWAREVGEMAGISLPLHPVEHQYLITETLPEIEALDKELPHVLDPEGGNYLRQERQGILIGFYEQPCTLWAVEGTPWSFDKELLPDQLDRLGDSLERAYHRYPVLEQAGIRQVINGPFTFAPDGNPLLGPVPGLSNYWSACGVMAGFSQGGGVGLALAQWMIEGAPERDVLAMDVARFGEFAGPDYTRKKVAENYERRFKVSYPNEELPAARPLHTSPMYDLWRDQNAVFGSGFGLEHVNYFAPAGEAAVETPTFRRSNAHAAVAAECKAVRESVGICEIHNFSKFLVEGPQAATWLDGIFAGHLPEVGRVSLSPMLDQRGRLIGDFTLTRLAEDRFQLTASYGAQIYHLRWFEQHLPEAGGVTVRNVSRDLSGFQIAGPKSRELLARVSGEDVSNTAFPFRHAREMKIGAAQVRVQRLSFTGDLGYELYLPLGCQVALYQALMQAGEDLALRPFGIYALLSLRLEKSFGSWGREYRPDYTPEETGLGRFIAYDKPADFIGKQASCKRREAGLKRRLHAFAVEAVDADVHGDEPISADGEVVGFVTSGGYAHHADTSVALGFLPADCPADAKLSVEILGKHCPMRRLDKPLFDPTGERMRG